MGRTLIKLGGKSGGHVTGPLVTDRLAGKIAVYYNKDDGWFRNQANGQSLGKAEQFVLRSALNFTPSDDVQFIIRGEHGSFDGDGSVGQNHALFPRGSFGVSQDTRGLSKADWNQITGELNIDAAGGTINLAHLLLGHGGELGWVEWLVFDERAGSPAERPYELRYGHRPGTDAAAGDMDQAVRALFDPDGVFPEQGQRF